MNLSECKLQTRTHNLINMELCFCHVISKYFMAKYNQKKQKHLKVKELSLLLKDLDKPNVKYYEKGASLKVPQLSEHLHILATQRWKICKECQNRVGYHLLSNMQNMEAVNARGSPSL